MREIIKQCLRNDLKDISLNHIQIKKGDVGNCSIEVIESDPVSLTSYIYLNESDRDKDYEVLLKLIKKAESIILMNENKKGVFEADLKKPKPGGFINNIINENESINKPKELM